MTRQEYTRCLVEIVLKDAALPKEAAAELRELLDTVPFDERRTCNVARNHLLAIIGTFPAEWDLVIAPHAVTRDESGVVKARDFFSGVYVYAEDIRSPFNLGSIFRTAEAFGAEKLFLSPGCTDPLQRRAVRSGMGCVELLGYERKRLEELPSDIPVFVLETGGTPISKFAFPEKGICIIGSEELGVSPAALERATLGCVSIPLKGMKASLNVGVAFGILMAHWVSSFTAR